MSGKIAPKLNGIFMRHRVHFSDTGGCTEGRGGLFAVKCHGESTIKST